jgi:hypothetical protein
MSVKIKPLKNEFGDYDYDSILVDGKYEIGKKLQFKDLTFKTIDHKVPGGKFYVSDHVILEDGQTYSKFVRESSPQSEEFTVDMDQKMVRPSYARNNYKKLFLLIALPIIIFIIFGYFGWNWHTGTPNYALRQIKKSVEESNRLLFESYVDVDKFCDDIVDEFMIAHTQNLMKDTDGNGWEKLGTMLGQKLVEGLKPALVASMSSSITKAVESGSFEHLWKGEKLEGGKPDINIFKKSNLKSDTFVGIGEIEKEDKRAYIPVQFEFPLIDTTLSFKLDMRKDDENWKIVGVADFTNFLNTIAQLQNEKIDLYNREIKTQFKSIVEIGKLSKQELGKSYSDNPKYLMLKYRIKNISPFVIQTGVIRSNLPKDANKEYIDFYIFENIRPGDNGWAEEYIDYNQFISWHKVVRRIKSDDLNPEPFYLILQKESSVDTVIVINSWSEYLTKMKNE